MKNCLISLLFVFPIFALAATVELSIVDESGEPVSGARVRVGFADFRGDGKTVKGLSDEQGQFQARGSPNHSILIWVSKDDHYPAEFEKLKPDIDHDLEVILPRVRNPRPLVYHHVTPKIPEFGEWFEFDLELGDWVAPYGIGETSDFVVRLSRDFIKINVLERDMIKIRQRNPNYTEEDFRRIWGIWNMFLEIRMTVDGEGIIESDQYYKNSELRLPHLAPNSEYKSELFFKNVSNKWSERQNDVGYFVRSRVILNADNQPVSVNYSKLLGESAADGGGAFSLEYYFNPDPNDRNLEYDGTNLAEEK